MQNADHTEAVDSQSSSSEEPTLDDHQDLKCPLCLDLFDDPCYICPNHHTLCRACYQGVLNSSSVPQMARCPQCRDRVSRPVENSHMRDLIDAVRQLHRRQQLQNSQTEQPRRINCQANEPGDCQRQAFGHCGHCERDLCDLHFSRHRLSFQTACQRQIQSASACMQVAERHEAAIAGWESLMDAFQLAVEQRRTKLRASFSASVLSATTMRTMRESVDQLRTALDAGDLRAAAASRDRLAMVEESALAAASASSIQLRQPPAELNRQLVEVRFGSLLDEAERLYREFRGDNLLTTPRQFTVTTRRRRIDAVRASDLALVTLRDVDGGEPLEQRRRPLWRRPEEGLRWPADDEEVNVGQAATDFESLEAISAAAANKKPPWRPLPNSVLYCKWPNSRQLLCIEPTTGCHLATIELTAALPHLVERLVYWSARRHLFLSNGQSVLECDLTGVCLRRLNGFRDATDVALDLVNDRLLILESRLGCVFVYALETLAPLQTLGRFGRSLHSMCWLSGAACQSPPALVLTDRAGPVRVFVGSGHLTALRVLPPVTAAPWTTSSTTLVASPSGDRLYIATPSCGIFCLPSRLIYDDELNSSSGRGALLISSDDLDTRTPAAMAILPAVDEPGGGFELLVCSGEVSAIDAFHLTTRQVQDDTEGNDDADDDQRG